MKEAIVRTAQRVPSILSRPYFSLILSQLLLPAPFCPALLSRRLCLASTNDFRKIWCRDEIIRRPSHIAYKPAKRADNFALTPAEKQIWPKLLMERGLLQKKQNYFHGIGDSIKKSQSF